MLKESFEKYFAANYGNLSNSAFLSEFENSDMMRIVRKTGATTRDTFISFSREPHVKATEELIYSKDSFLDEAKIYYATPEAIQAKINSLNSTIRFMQDTGANSWDIERFEAQRDSFVAYQRELEGKPTIELSLEKLDSQAKMLEALDSKTQDLLQQYENADKANAPTEEENDIEIGD